MDAYGDRLYSFASRVCRNSEDAKDVVQETLIAVFRSLKDFRGESRFRTWLFTIAANACRKMKRKGKFEPEQELSLDEFMPVAQQRAKIEIADWSQNPDELFRRDELRTVVEAAIAGLPRKYRIVLLLRDLEQLSTDETAEALGLSPEAVKSRLHRARLYVRQQLSQYWQTGA
jgi:RNA polymerase sigma-70 factor (ECF subfamily)